MLSEILKLISYKAWANDITFSALSELPDAELKTERKTNFKNIISTLNHIFVVDDIFKAHLLGLKHQYTHRNTDVCPSFLSLRQKQKSMDQWYRDFVEKIDEEKLKEIINFKFVDGEEGNMMISDILLHLINHGSYHRGFVSDMMYQIPAIPPANDYTVFLRDFYQQQ